MNNHNNTKRKLEFTVDGHLESFELEGETAWGSDIILLDQEDDLIKNSNFKDLGYVVDKFISPDLNQQIIEKIRSIVYLRIKEVKTFDLEFELFHLEDYHKYVNDEEHIVVVEPFRAWLDASLLPCQIEFIEDRVSEILNTQVSTLVPHYGRKTFAIRIIRPLSKDYNPPHRDPWVDILKGSVNAYIPIAGSSNQSSLPLLPGSHRWKESEIERTVRGARVNGKEYVVPSVVSSTRALDLIRPNPEIGEILVFTPYLIHGGGLNQQEDITRVSLEMRYWRK